MGINTGTPGFDINGKSYTYDTQDPSSPPDPGYPITTDRGDFPADSNDPPKKDISQKTKVTLADYLGQKTSINAFPVDGTATSVGTVGNNNTVPPIPSPESTTSNSAYFTLNGQKGRPEIGGTTQSSPGLKAWMTSANPGDRKFVPPNVALADVKKGKESAQGGLFDGNKLLPSVTSDPGVLTDYTSAVLSNNRFIAAKGVGFSTGDPASDFNPDMFSPKFGRFSANRMAQLGASLSIRASQEMNSTDAGLNPNSGGEEAKAILPGINQLGASRINYSVLAASDAMLDLSQDEATNFVSPSPGSWGALNNVLDTYDGITSFGMLTLSIALTAAVTVLIEGLGLILSLVKNDPDPSKNVDGRYILGRASVGKQTNPGAFPPGIPPDLGALLGIRPTTFPFKDAVTKGTFVFFGIDDSAGPFGAVLGALSKAADSPGFNVVTCRTIIRSGVTIADSIKKALGSGNLISAIKNILSIIDVIKSSKIMSAINVFAMLGDAVLSENPDDIVQGRQEEPQRKSFIDNIVAGAPGAAAIKNRISDLDTGLPSLKLAWASNRSPSLYLLPTAVAGLAAAGDSLGSFSTGLGRQETATRVQYHLVKNDEGLQSGFRIKHGKGGTADQIDRGTLQSIEAELEAEYVPFYFHDIRTNEVISFHAFLSSINDDYSAAYESSDGFGRVEPVKIYKGTQRKIGLSFYIASTSVQDFDEMWVKINKLTTLVYPQYTEGRRLVSADTNYNFTQPFSQMIGASPMIRLRLGNLFRSNYSRFALARLFGATLGGAQLDGTPMSFEDAGEKLELLKNKLAPVAGPDLWIVTMRTPVSDEPGVGSIGLSLPSIGPPSADNTKTWNIDGYAAYMPVTIVSADTGAGTARVKPDQPDGNDLTSIGVSDDAAQMSIMKYIDRIYNNPKNPKQYVIGGTYTVPLNHIVPSPALYKKVNADLVSAAGPGLGKLNTFMSNDNNALVKSFRSAGGKGLAGFIESMNFDWFDHVMWDTDIGKKAPMMCKVTISFSPIHDISPGIDSQGYNRSPIYPVGFMAPQFTGDSDISEK